MEFSSVLLTTYVDAESSPSEDERVLAAAEEQAQVFAQHGIYPWTTEHHFRGAWQSSPLQFMAHVAARLPAELYLGFGVLSVPYHHPVRLVEDINLLDQLTKGRTVFGLGSGFPSRYERPGFGVEAAHHGSGRAARDAIAVMERLWGFKSGDEPFEFDNGLYAGRVEKRVVPAPYRRERPTIVRTAGSEAATIAAAQKGWPVFLGTMGMDLVSQWNMYRRALEEADHDPEIVAECLRWSTVNWNSVLVDESERRAQSAAEIAKAARLADRARYVDNLGLVSPGPVDGDVLTNEAFLAGADMSDTIAGTPDVVAIKVQRLNDLGINHVIVRFLGEWLGDTRGVVERSVELFAREVAPRFAGVPAQNARQESSGRPV